MTLMTRLQSVSAGEKDALLCRICDQTAAMQLSGEPVDFNKALRTKQIVGIVLLVFLGSFWYDLIRKRDGKQEGRLKSLLH